MVEDIFVAELEGDIHGGGSKGKGPPADLSCQVEGIILGDTRRHKLQLNGFRSSTTDDIGREVCGVKKEWKLKRCPRRAQEILQISNKAEEAGSGEKRS